jgi:phospholipid/cholesterol/gamma-HCH transport system ATP-binding protein
MSAHLLDLIDVHKTLGAQKVLRGVNLQIAEGENMVIIGRSGGGKSVLLRHIMGLVRPDKGQVWYRGHDLATISEENLTFVRREMGMLFQNGALFDSLNVGENVAFSLREEGKLAEADIQKEVQRALKIVDLPGQENKMPSELSGGMRKRVALARAAISRPKLMLYDEPTAGLDPIVSDSINKLILRLGEDLNMTAIIVTHDMVSAYEIADRIAMLHEGKIYCVDTPQTIQNSEDPIIKRFVRGISAETDAIF